MDFCKEIAFETSEIDPYLLVQVKGCGKVIVALYVDDCPVAAPSELIDELFKELSGRFEIFTKPASDFLGIEIERRGDEMKIF